MAWGIFFQIIGVILVASGSILAITKLWQGFFKKSKDTVDFLNSFYNNFNDYDNKIIKKQQDFLKNVGNSNANSEEKKYLNVTIKRDREQVKELQDNLKKMIDWYNTTEERFLLIGVSLIITGSVLQVFGLLF